MPPVPPPRVPATLESWTLGALRRTAGSLAVHAATDRLGLPVDVHVVRAEALPPDFPPAEFLGVLRRAADVRHESLLPFLTGGREGDLLYAVAKSADAPALDEVVARGGALAEDRVLAVGAAVAGVLATLERAKLRHGDLTPRRVLLPGRGQVAVGPPRLLPVSVAPRNERYQSPEEARGGAGDVRSDLFVLGLLLVEALRGEAAFRGSAADAAKSLAAGTVPPVVAPGARSATLAVLARLVAADPAGRYATAAAAEQALTAAAAALAAPVVTIAPIDLAPPETAPIASLAPAPPAAPIPVPAAAVAPAIRSAPPSAVPASPAAAASPAGPAPDSSPSAVRRSPGRVYLTARLGEALLEIEETVFAGRPAGANDVVVKAEPFDGAAFRIERSPETDVLVALGPGVTVNGAAAERHALSHGDAIAGPGIQGRYERSARVALRATGAGVAADVPAQRPGAARLVVAAALVVALVGIAAAVHRLRGGRGPAEQVEKAAAAAELALAEERKSAPAPVAKAAGGSTEREQAARDAFDAALAAARRNPADPADAIRRLRDVAERYGETGHGALARAEAAELERRSRAVGGGGDLDHLLATSREDADRGRLDQALLALRNYAELHPGTIRAERARGFAVLLENDIAARFEGDMARVERAAASGDLARARRILDEAMDYVPTSLRDRALEMGRRLDAGRDAAPQRPPEGPPPAPPGEGAGRDPGSPPTKPPEEPGPAPPPPGPSPVDPEEAANEAFRAAKKSMDAGRDDEALAGFLEFLKKHKETKVGAKYDLDARQRITRLSEGPAGLAALFRGKVEKAEKGRLRIRYDFEDAAQLLDFRDVEAFEAPPRAKWSVQSGTVRAKGSGAFVLDATFRPDFLTAAVTVNPERAHDLGVAFLDSSEPRRFYLFMLQNTFFTLGKGAAAQVFEENAIVLFGPGMWRDTPPGQIGFVRKCGSAEPAVRPAESFAMKAGKAEGNVWMRFPNGKQIQGSAYGDVKLEFPGLEPAVFVMNSGGTFDDLVIEGTPDPEWVARRWRAILSNL